MRTEKTFPMFRGPDKRSTDLVMFFFFACVGAAVLDVGTYSYIRNRSGALSLIAKQLFYHELKKIHNCMYLQPNHNDQNPKRVW